MAEPPKTVKLNRSIPKSALKHIETRLRSRQISVYDVRAILAWVLTEPTVPEGPWYKEFIGCILVGTGSVPTSVLEQGMNPWGTKVSSAQLEVVARIRRRAAQPARLRSVAGKPVVASLPCTEQSQTKKLVKDPTVPRSPMLTRQAAPRSVWFHGSSIRNLRSILTQGLLPDVRKKNWDQDRSQGSVIKPSLESYGGIYVTQNVITAVSAPQDRIEEGREVLVSMELQPNTFYLDEDDITGRLDAPIAHISDSALHTAMFYIAATRQEADEGFKTDAETFRQQYTDKNIENWKTRLRDAYEEEMHPDLEARLRALLPACWIAALARRASHGQKQEKSDFEARRAYAKVCYTFLREKDLDFDQYPTAAELFPTSAEAEKQFRDAIEPVTRALRKMARPEGSSVYNMNTARVTEPIGYSGSNRITAVLEIREGTRYVGEDWKKPVQVIVHYGTVPKDFLEQWSARKGPNFEIDYPNKVAMKSWGIRRLAAATSGVYYHGGPDIPGNILKSGQSGAIFFTQSREYAIQYMKSRGEATGVLYQIELDFTSRRIFDPESEKDIAQLKQGFLKLVEDGDYATNADALSDYQHIVKLDLMDWATGSQYLEAIEAAGFHGMRMRERPGNISLNDDGSYSVSGAPIESVALFDPEVKVERAPDQPFASGAKSAASSGYPQKIWFHGSKNYFTSFQTFSKPTVNREATENPIFLTPDRSFAELHAGHRGWVYEVTADVSNTFKGRDMRTPGERYYDDPRTGTALGKQVYEALLNNEMFPDAEEHAEAYWKALAEENWDTMQAPGVMKWLKENGFDSFFEFGEGQENLAVFDPSRLTILSTTPMSDTSEKGLTAEELQQYYNKLSRKTAVESVLPATDRSITANIGKGKTAGDQIIINTPKGHISGKIVSGETFAEDWFVDVPYNRVAYLDLVYTKPECQRQGVATDLVKQFLAQAEAKGAEACLLEPIPSDGPADVGDLHTFYSKLGFTDLPFDPDDHDEPPLVMVKVLKNLKKQAADMTETSGFKSWFGKSKIVDGEGKPLVVHHGTDADFDTFDRAMTKSGPSKFGFWFARDKDFAELFGSKQMATYLKMERPYKITSGRWNAIRDAHAKDTSWFERWRDKLVKEGYDGLIVAGEQFISSKGIDLSDPTVFAVFNANQIKSVNNSGNFDANNPMITASEKVRVPRTGKIVKLNATGWYERGYKDGFERQKATWDFSANHSRDAEDEYFRGYKKGKEQASIDSKKRTRFIVPQALTSYVDSGCLSQIVRFLLESSDLIDAPSPTEVTGSQISAVLEDFVGRIHEGTVTAYRSMDCPTTWGQKDLVSRGAGLCWTLDEKKVMSHHGLESRRIVLSAEIPLSSIDWIATIAVRLNNVEDEVRLKQGAPLIVESIEGEGAETTGLPLHVVAFRPAAKLLKRQAKLPEVKTDKIRVELADLWKELAGKETDAQLNWIFNQKLSNVAVELTTERRDGTPISKYIVGGFNQRGRTLVVIKMAHGLCEYTKHWSTDQVPPGWQDFVNRFASIYSHEITHQNQDNAQAEKNPNARSRGYSSKVNFETVEGLVEYLSDKQEIAAFARGAVEELRDAKWSDMSILRSIRDKDLWKYMKPLSVSFRTYMEVARKPGKAEVFRRFLQEMVKALDGKDVPISAEEKEAREQFDQMLRGRDKAASREFRLASAKLLTRRAASRLPLDTVVDLTLIPSKKEQKDEIFDTLAYCFDPSGKSVYSSNKEAEKSDSGISEIIDHFQARGLDIALYESNGYLTLSKVVVPETVRGQGIGSEFMREVCNYADRTQQFIFLTPSKDFGAKSLRRLMDFYRGFGFVSNKGRNKDFRSRDLLVRKPTANYLTRQAATLEIYVSDVAEALEKVFQKIRMRQGTPFNWLKTFLSSVEVGLFPSMREPEGPELADYLTTAQFDPWPKVGHKVTINFAKGFEEAINQRKHQKPQELTAMKRQILTLVTHERVHLYQDDRIREKNPDQLDHIQAQNAYRGLAYLARPSEIGAYAVHAVYEMRNNGLTDQTILNQLSKYKSQAARTFLCEESNAFRKYVNMDDYVQRKRNNPGDVDPEFLKRDVMREFVEKMVQQLDVPASKAAAASQLLYVNDTIGNVKVHIEKENGVIEFDLWKFNGKTGKNVHVGFLKVNDFEDGTAGVFKVEIEPAFRKMGIGRAVYLYAAEYLRDQGFESLSSDSTQMTDGAIGLWDSLTRTHDVRENEGFNDPRYTLKLAADQIPYQPLLAELMQVLKPGLPTPEIVIVNRKARWLGQDVWQIRMSATGESSCDDNTRIELQKSVMADETTLRRILAHELAHHEDNLLNEKPEFLRVGFRTYRMMRKFDSSRGHGPKWQEIAARFNAKYGEGFVTTKSDESYVLDSTDVKPYFVLLQHFNGKTYFTHATRISPKMKTYLQVRADKEPGGYEYRLFMTTDPFFMQKSSNIGSGKWAYVNTNEDKTKIQKLWDEGENILPQYVTGKTAGLLTRKASSIVLASGRTA